jgi:hypothetical protein
VQTFVAPVNVGKVAPRLLVNTVELDRFAGKCDALVADHNAAGGQDHLDVAQAEADAVIRPDRMLDDFGRKAKVTVSV